LVLYDQGIDDDVVFNCTVKRLFFQTLYNDQDEADLADLATIPHSERMLDIHPDERVYAGPIKGFVHNLVNLTDATEFNTLGVRLVSSINYFSHMRD
jgi:hypothetical protein